MRRLKASAHRPQDPPVAQDVRNAALAAAFFAATDARPIQMEDVIRGLKREFQKTGKLRTPVEFDRYYHLVAEDDAAPAR